jgi:hypothetical protein
MVKKLAASVTVVLLATIGLVTIHAHQVSAAEAAAEPAVVISDFGCNLFNGMGVLVFTNESHGVITSSNNDNSMMRCQAQVTPSPEGRAVRFNYDNTGMLCMTQSGATDRWNNVVSASGQATLTCHYKN